MPGLGHKSYLQMGPESVYGIAAPCTAKLEVLNIKLDPSIGVIQDPSLYAKQSRRALYQGGFAFKGTFAVRANYEGMLELMRAISGTYDGGNVAPGETTVWDHKFTEGPTLRSYTLELGLGDVPATKVNRIVGAKLLNVVIRGTAGQGADAMLQAEFTVAAKSMTTAATPTGTVGPITGTIATLTTFTRSGGSNLTDGIVAGMTATGASVPAGTTVVSVTDATHLVLSATSTGATSITFALASPNPLPALFSQAITVDDGNTADNIVIGSLTSNSTTTITRGSGSFINDGVKAGFYVIGPGIPIGTHVASLVGGSVTLDVAATTSVAGTLTLQFAAARVRAFEFSLENPHDEQRYFLGSINPDEPLRSDFIKTSYKFTKEFATINDYAVAAAFTNGSPSLVFQHPGNIGVAPSHREFEVHSNAAQLTSYSNPVEGYGVIVSTATWEAYYDATTDLASYVIRVRSGESPSTLAP
jgi:hypothetical protein